MSHEAISKKAFSIAGAARVLVDVPFWWMVCVALATRSFYQPIVSIQDALVYGLGHAVLYRALYALVSGCFSPWKLALLWLGSPLLLFSATWLRPVWAIVFASCWSFALWWSIQQQSSQEKNASNGGLAGYLIVLAWVSVCGAGGYGYQSSDYVMHNGRLLDLINYSWPVSYTHADGSVSILVQYAAYYLWPALLGKIAGISAAMVAQHLWLLMGCWIALRMLALLTGVQTWAAALGLVLFGGWNLVVGLLFEFSANFHTLMATYMHTQTFSVLRDGIPGFLDFWPATVIQQDVWFGNFISLASSMLWSPNQMVAGWLVVGLLYRAHCQQRVPNILFACSLLVFWSPMIALGMFSLVFMLAFIQWKESHYEFSMQGAGFLLIGISVVCVLGIYYASVPLGNQPHGVLSLQAVCSLPFMLFLLQSWGLYAAAVAVCRRWMSERLSQFSCAVFIASALVSCMYYGVYNDLLVRTSSALYFAMLLVLLSALCALWREKVYRHILFICVILMPGLLGSSLIVWQAVAHADLRVAGQRVVDYGQGWQFMGRENSWFVRYLSADIYKEDP